jgi:hypothetical protein
MNTFAHSPNNQDTHHLLDDPSSERLAKGIASSPRDRLYFLWDYDLSEQDVWRIVRQGNPAERAWIISRILEYAKWDDIWRYLTVADIRHSFAQLSFRRAQDRELWAYALDRWTHDAA